MLREALGVVVEQRPRPHREAVAQDRRLRLDVADIVERPAGFVPPVLPVPLQPGLQLRIRQAQQLLRVFQLQQPGGREEAVHVDARQPHVVGVLGFEAQRERVRGLEVELHQPVPRPRLDHAAELAGQPLELLARPAAVADLGTVAGDRHSAGAADDDVAAGHGYAVNRRFSPATRSHLAVGGQRVRVRGDVHLPVPVAVLPQPRALAGQRLQDLNPVGVPLVVARVVVPARPAAVPEEDFLGHSGEGGFLHLQQPGAEVFFIPPPGRGCPDPPHTRGSARRADRVCARSPPPRAPPAAAQSCAAC